jgi:hypothetical protein
MRALLLIIALLCSHIGCAQPMSTRRFNVEGSTPLAQRNGGSNLNRSRADSRPAPVLPEAPGVSRAPREGAPAAPTGTAGRDEAEEGRPDAGGTTATAGSSDSESKEAAAPFSYSVAVAQPSSARGRLAAGLALGAGVIAIALWTLRRRLR